MQGNLSIRSRVNPLGLMYIRILENLINAQIKVADPDDFAQRFTDIIRKQVECKEMKANG